MIQCRSSVVGAWAGCVRTGDGIFQIKLHGRIDGSWEEHLQGGFAFLRLEPVLRNFMSWSFESRLYALCRKRCIGLTDLEGCVTFLRHAGTLSPQQHSPSFQSPAYLDICWGPQANQVPWGWRLALLSRDTPQLTPHDGTAAAAASTSLTWLGIELNSSPIIAKPHQILEIQSYLSANISSFVPHFHILSWSSGTRGEGHGNVTYSVTMKEDMVGCLQFAINESTLY